MMKRFVTLLFQTSSTAFGYNEAIERSLTKLGF